MHTIVSLRLSTSSEAEPGALFLAGFFEVNALVLVKNRPIVEALDQFLAGITADRFKDVLPSLRRAFSALGVTERRYLLENIVSLRGLVDRSHAARSLLEEQDREKLRAMGGEIGDVMDALDDLL